MAGARNDEGRPLLPPQEREELRSTFCKVHPELKLKQLGDYEDLEMWLDKYHPAA